jgi:macrolide transport system ATP-binding/permease protein
LSILFQDLRYALRQLRKTPSFTLTVILTLALGIGANTAIFTLVHGILMRSLPVADPAQLYRIGDDNKCCVEGGFPEDAASTGDFSIFSFDLYQYLKNSSPAFEQLAAVEAGGDGWGVRRGNELTRLLGGEIVSGNYFSTLGIGAYAGRVFSDSDDTPSSSPAVVLSYDAWQGEYAGDPSIVGSTIYIQTRPFTVVGIAARGFYGDRISDTPPELWVPIQMEPYLRGEGAVIHHPESHWLYLVGRVRAGTNIVALQTRISEALRQWIYSRPAMIADGGAALVPRQHVVLTPAGGGIQRMQHANGKRLKMLMILSSVVLLIACANIANLMLARATAHRSEVAIRMALGAGSRRVIRQIITESILLSLLGGLAGLGVAYAGCQTILKWAFPNAKYMPLDPSPSLPVLGFAFAVTLITGVVFGLAPAWLSSHAQPSEALRGVNRVTRDRSSLPQKSLVVFQAALSVVLLAAAILVTRSLANLENQNFGVVTHNRYVLRFDAEAAGYDSDRAPALNRKIEESFRALPGVTSFSMALYSPLEDNNWAECVIQQGHPAPGPNAHCGSTWDRVSTHFLDSIGVPMVRGRDFSEHDTDATPQVAIVNQEFVKRFFPDKDPIGQHFGIDLPQYSGAFEIVGVFASFKMNQPYRPVRPVFLRPLTQRYAGYKEKELLSGENHSMIMNDIIIGFNQPPQNVDTLMRRTMAGINPNITIRDIRTFEQQVAGNFTQDRLIARLASLFGLLALILASVGLYGVMSYFVARRTSEIGIRMALGATRLSVVAMVMQGAFWQIAMGLLLGIPGALYAGHLMKSMLYDIESYDLLAIAGAPLMLIVCAALAGFIPARRAASIEPMQALRTE